ncbi:NRDE family protein [Candidatus Neomarinimicrobiota bacterium]
MCTILARFNPDDPWPVAFLINRDEAYDRPMEDWEWYAGDVRVFAPRDRRSGGTWVGLNNRGVVAALTNIQPGLPDTDFRSRGVLVNDVLKLENMQEAPALMHGMIDRHTLNTFNLIAADREAMYIFAWEKGNMKIFVMSPGLFEVKNSAYNGDSVPLDNRDNQDWLQTNADVLKEHPDICKHGNGYGTRCSHKILLSGADPVKSQVWHTEGPPCTNPYVQVLPIRERWSLYE